MIRLRLSPKTAPLRSWDKHRETHKYILHPRRSSLIWDLKASRGSITLTTTLVKNISNGESGISDICSRWRWEAKATSHHPYSIPDLLLRRSLQSHGFVGHFRVWVWRL